MAGKKDKTWKGGFEDVSSFSNPAASRRPSYIPSEEKPPSRQPRPLPDRPYPERSSSGRPPSQRPSPRPSQERPPSKRISPERRPPERRIPERSPAERSSAERSSGTSRKKASSGRPARRPEPDWEIPSWEISEEQRRSISKKNRPPSGPIKRTGPVLYSGKPKKGLGRGTRRALVFFTILLMVAVTAILAVFLLFKVSSIEVTGDLIEGYDNDTIISVSGCKIGDNLFFSTTADKEERLSKQLPYIGKAKIHRHIPGTLEIEITATRAAACLSEGQSWICIDSAGKILESRDQPADGLLQIQGMITENTMPGQQINPQDEDALYACSTILDAINDRELLGGFTSLDLTNLLDIRLVYQNRIEFLLGSVADLSYKVDFGCRSLSELTENDKGTLDLRYAGTTKGGTFSQGEIGAPVSSAPGQDVSSPSSGGDQVAAGSSPGSEPPPEDYRDDGIPDAPFTGGE